MKVDVIRGRNRLPVPGEVWCHSQNSNIYLRLDDSTAARMCYDWQVNRFYSIVINNTGSYRTAAWVWTSKDYSNDLIFLKPIKNGKIFKKV